MLDFPNMLNDFKRTDLDPRELVLMHKYLLVSPVGSEKSYVESLQKHFTKTEFTIDISNIIDRYKMQNDKMNINTNKKV